MICVVYQGILQVRVHGSEYGHLHYLVQVLDHMIHLHIIVAQVEVGLVSTSSDLYILYSKGSPPVQSQFQMPMGCNRPRRLAERLCGPEIRSGGPAPFDGRSSS
jgi:hypothetical protein